MTDPTRSATMSRIRGRDTLPEVTLRSACAAAGMVGAERRIGRIRPDLVLETERVVVFVDGCFWHGCPEHYSRPGSREMFWAEKLAGNVLRDRRQTAALEEAGWVVVRCWEHEVHRDVAAVVDRVRAAVERRQDVRVDWRVVRVVVVDAEARIERRELEDLRDEGLTKQITARRIAASGRAPARGRGTSAVTETA